MSTTFNKPSYYLQATLYFMDELKKELLHLGLSDKESAVYLAALELGPSPVQDISHKSKVNRATTYVMIESLSSRGLMSTFQKGKKRFYVAESPDRLMSILRLQQKELEEKKSELEGVLPMLMSLYNAEGAKPQVRYLEGLEGFETTRAVFEQLEGDFIQVTALDEWGNLEGVDMRDRDVHLDKLVKDGVKGRVFALKQDRDLSWMPEKANIELRFLDENRFPIKGELAVRGSHVFLFSHRSSVLSLVIVSQEIADVIRALFDLAWEKAA